MTVVVKTPGLMMDTSSQFCPAVGGVDTVRVDTVRTVTGASLKVMFTFCVVLLDPNGTLKFS